jgi:hypothetical protein
MGKSSIGSQLTERLRTALTSRPVVDGPSGDEEQRKGLQMTLCLLASILLWFSFSMRETYTRIVEIPLEVTNLQEGDALLAVPPVSARAQIEGEGIQLLRLYYNPPSLLIDASGDSFDLITAGPEIFTNVRLDAITPRTVSLLKDRRISRKVPLRPRVSIVTAPGHHVIGEVVLEPDSVTISGAESIVSNLQDWPTRRLQVKPEGDTVAVRVALSDSLGALIEIDHLQASYSASVREFTEGVRTIEVRVINANAGQTVQLDPPTVRIMYQVALDQYDAALNAEDFFAEVDFNAMRADVTGSVTPVIHYPAGIEFREYRLDPPTHSYYLEDLFD